MLFPARLRATTLWTAVLAAAPLAPAAAQVVASTFSPGDGFDASFGQAVTAGVVPDPNGGFVSQAVAASFTYEPSSPEPLAQFRFAATANDGSDPLQVRFLAGPDLNAATTLERFTFMADSAPGTAEIFTARSALFPLLQPGRTYWIALALAPTSTAEWAWNVNDHGLAGVSIANPLGTPWVAAPDGETPAFDVSVAPEPATAALAAAGLAAGGVVARRRTRRPGLTRS